MNHSPLKVTLERDGRLLSLILARPKANIIDGAMIAALQAGLDQHIDQTELSAVLLRAEGPNFSFGASVQEHLPAQCERMLKDLHRLILTLIEYPVPVLAAVRGFCFGGGLELACTGPIFAAPDASFGQPEIQLGVFAPAASCLLPERIGQARAEDLLLSGRTIDAQHALHIGLVNAVSEQPESAALDYFDRYLVPHSGCALRHALWAARHDAVARVKDKLAAVEKRYLQELMSSHDASEGLNAFIEKRSPRWTNR